MHGAQRWSLLTPTTPGTGHGVSFHGRIHTRDLVGLRQWPLPRTKAERSRRSGLATLGVRANKTMFSTTILRKPHGPRRIGCASREMKGSMRALCVGCFILVASVALVNAGDTCPVAVAPSLRVDCAYPGVTERQCAERKCCWGPGQASGVPECYYPGEAVPITTVHVVQVRQVVALALGGGAVVTAVVVRVRLDR